MEYQWIESTGKTLVGTYDHISLVFVRESQESCLPSVRLVFTSWKVMSGLSVYFSIFSPSHLFKLSPEFQPYDVIMFGTKLSLPHQPNQSNL